MALTVGVGTVMEAREILVIISGAAAEGAKRG
jgi:6-phosphogluconolactonase/glucosamine-6-phosphate isomerase/deaminase